MNDSPRRSSDLLIANLMVFGHAVTGILLVLFLLLMVPRYDKIFRDFGMKLSSLGERVVSLSRWVGEIWYFLPFLVAILLVLDCAVLFLLRSGKRTRVLSWLWFTLWLVIPLVLLAVFWIALWEPLTRLVESLSKS